MADEIAFGFTEIEHTADWALKVWAPNLPVLFTQAALGMYWLMETRLSPEPRVEQHIEVKGVDSESLLVSFLSELLYNGEADGLGFDQFEIAVASAAADATAVEESHLQALVRGAPIAEQRKEIKAVTYHNLAILKTERGLEVTIVFDV